MNPCLTPKKRATPRLSVLFASLEKGESFYLNPKLRAVKTSFCTARPYAPAALSATDWGKQTPWQFVNPFKSVFVDRRPALSLPPGVSIRVEPLNGPVNDGITHLVGDDCPGGHGEVAQPSSDNKVTGPIS